MANYLSNKELLKYIHASKCTFSSFRSEEDHDYDLIIDDFEINDQIINQAKKARAKRLKIDLDSIQDQDLVFRIMTNRHIPQDKVKIKTNFPPFQHLRIDDDDYVIVVGKSHWSGGLENGEFCQTHGHLTDELVKAFMLLCQRIAMKTNWRGYSYIDEMQSAALLNLCAQGLKFDESRGNNPFAFYTTTVKNAFTKVLNTEKKSQKTRDSLLEANGLTPSHTRQTENSLGE